MKDEVNTTTVICLSSILIIILGQFILTNNLDYKTTISFEDEDVIISINNVYADFYARYGLKNFGKSEFYWITLPFALKPWNISLFLDETPLNYTWIKSFVDPEIERFDAILFKVNIEPLESKDIIVKYQRNFEREESNGTEKIIYRYIVGSTRSWNAPLNFAHFEFWFKDGNRNDLLEVRDYYNWMPEVTFLNFEYITE